MRNEALQNYVRDSESVKEKLNNLRGQYNNTVLFYSNFNIDFSLTKIQQIINELNNYYIDGFSCVDLLLSDNNEAIALAYESIKDMISIDNIPHLRSLINYAIELRDNLHLSIPQKLVKSYNEAEKNKIKYNFNIKQNSGESLLLFIEQVKKSILDNCGVESKLFIQDVFMYCLRVANG